MDYNHHHYKHNIISAFKIYGTISQALDRGSILNVEIMVKIGKTEFDKLLDRVIRDGSNIMLIGPPMSKKVLNHITYHEIINETAVISVNTNESETRILEWFKENELILSVSRFRVVDCITKKISHTAEEDENIKVVESPVDLTGIGVGISQFFEEFFIKKNIQKIQLNINSISTLLMYSNIRTIYRFLLRVIGSSLKPTPWLEYEVDRAKSIGLEIETAAYNRYLGRITSV